MNRVRVAVVGAGSFGRNHVRVLSQLPEAELAAVVDADPARAQAVASEFSCPAFSVVDELPGDIRAAVVAVPTSLHAEIGEKLLERGIDVLVEKPIAHDVSAARALVETAKRNGRVLHVGHLERFNPAVAALKKITRLPLFFEIHRMSLFSPRSLDVDVVLDLMIHDIDIVLHLVGEAPSEIRAAGISVLSDKPDIANVRLAFPGGCVANLTASRVSTERVRKLRLFQPHQYISLDYQRQEGAVFSVSATQQIGFESLATVKDEPLKLELRAFLAAVGNGEFTAVSGEEGLQALEAAAAILDNIEEHAKLVAQRMHAAG